MKILKNNTRNLLLFLPAFLMAFLPWSLEKDLNISICDYDLSILLIPGFIIIASKIRNRYSVPRADLYIYVFFLFALFSLISLDGQYIGHYFIGIEFIWAFIFAKNIKYNDGFNTILLYSSLLLLAAILFQQVSLSLGLGFIDSGQAQNVELNEGLLRVGTSVGAATITAIFVCLLVGIIISITQSKIISLVAFALGLLSVLLSGTRSAMIVILVMAFKYLFFGELKIKVIYKAIIIVLAIIYIFPFLGSIIEARNEIAFNGDDYTSGRIDRWIDALNILSNSKGSYFLGAGAGTVPITAFSEDIERLASPHNVYIGILFQFGIIGLIVFIIFLWKKIKYSLKLVGMNSANVCLIMSLLVSWNTEVVPLMFIYAFYFWMLYFSNIRNSIK